MAKMFWASDTNPRALEGKRVAVLGYGSQGRAHALNLRDSKINTVVGLRRGGPSWKQAEQDGWALVGPSEATEGADVIVMLAPDMAQPSRFSIMPRVLGETCWPFSSLPSVRSVTPVASARARLSRMPSSTRRATT